MANTTSLGVPTVYGRSFVAYTRNVRRPFHVGHALREARKERGWNQEQLGEAARRVLLPGTDASDETERINKFTVSKAEREPYSRKYSTLVRLAGALGRTVGELESDVHVTPAFPREVKPRRPLAAGPGR
jgi:transcriptional regulator with XRE-family HTH domain